MCFRVQLAQKSRLQIPKHADEIQLAAHLLIFSQSSRVRSTYSPARQGHKIAPLNVVASSSSCSCIIAELSRHGSGSARKAASDLAKTIKGVDFCASLTSMNVFSCKQGWPINGRRGDMRGLLCMYCFGHEQSDSTVLGTRCTSYARW